MTAGLQPDPTSSRILIVIVALGNKVISSKAAIHGFMKTDIVKVSCLKLTLVIELTQFNWSSKAHFRGALYLSNNCFGFSETRCKREEVQQQEQ